MTNVRWICGSGRCCLILIKWVCLNKVSTTGSARLVTIIAPAFNNARLWRPAFRNWAFDTLWWGGGVPSKLNRMKYFCNRYVYWVTGGELLANRAINFWVSVINWKQRSWFGQKYSQFSLLWRQHQYAAAAGQMRSQLIFTLPSAFILTGLVSYFSSVAEAF